MGKNGPEKWPFFGHFGLNTSTFGQSDPEMEISMKKMHQKTVSDAQIGKKMPPMLPHVVTGFYLDSPFSVHLLLRRV